MNLDAGNGSPTLRYISTEVKFRFRFAHSSLIGHSLVAQGEEISKDPLIRLIQKKGEANSPVILETPLLRAQSHPAVQSLPN
jgi:hypothetical protein